LCYDQFAVLSVQAIKEQQIKIDQQQLQIDQQQTLNTEYQHKLEAQDTEIQSLHDEMAQLKLQVLQVTGKR